MNTFERLLKADTAKPDQMQKKVIKSKRLAFVIGEEEPVDITIRALNTREIQYVQDFLSDKNGKVIPQRYLDANFIICTKGIVNPDISNQQLISHFGVKDSKALVEKLFQAEAANIATEIMTLSGAGEDVNAEIKNS